MIGNVFCEADRVIAWLGPEADNSEMDMGVIADKTACKKRQNAGATVMWSWRCLLPKR